MSPTAVDELTDEMWWALVRHMQREADALNQQQARTRLPTLTR
jgi:hypothetical protein